MSLFDVVWKLAVEARVEQVVVLLGVVLSHFVGDRFLLRTEDALNFQGT